MQTENVEKSAFSPILPFRQPSAHARHCCKIRTMPAHYIIDKERRLILTTGEGVLTFPEIKSHQNRLIADPDFDPTFNQFIDVTTVEKLDLSFEQAKTLARQAVLSRASRRAVVANEKSVYGMFRLMQTYHEGIKSASHVAIFYDRAEALTWLASKTVLGRSDPY